MEKQRLSRVSPGLSPVVAKRFVRSVAYVTGKGQMGSKPTRHAQRCPSAQCILFSSEVCSWKETLTNWSNRLSSFLITYTNTPEFLKNFFSPPRMPRDCSKTAKYRYIYKNTSRWQRSPKALKKSCTVYLIDLLVSSWQLGFNFDFLSPSTKCHMLSVTVRWHLDVKSAMEVLYLNSTVRWKCVL